MTPEAERYWRQFWTDPAFRGRPYGYSDPIYTKGYHRATDLRYQGLALNVPLLRGGVIVAVGNGGAIGRFVAVKPYRPGDYGFVENEFDIYCHLSGAFLPQVSTLTERKAGDILFRLARADEQPGSAWTGPHLHFVVANHPDGGWNTQRADRDPGPIIDSVFSGLAGGGGTPFEPKREATSDMFDMAIIRDKETNQVFGFSANGRIKHLPEQSAEGNQAEVACYMAGQRTVDGTYFVHEFSRAHFTAAVYTARGPHSSVYDVLNLAAGNSGAELPPVF